MNNGAIMAEQSLTDQGDRQGWPEAIAQQTLPLSQLWEGIDAES